MFIRVFIVSRGSSHLYAVRIVVEQQDSQTRHLLGFHHCLHVCQEVHVFGHICGQHLNRTTITRKHVFSLPFRREEVCSCFPCDLNMAVCAVWSSFFLYFYRQLWLIGSVGC